MDHRLYTQNPARPRQRICGQKTASARTDNRRAVGHLPPRYYPAAAVTVGGAARSRIRCGLLIRLLGQGPRQAVHIRRSGGMLGSQADPNGNVLAQAAYWSAHHPGTDGLITPETAEIVAALAADEAAREQHEVGQYTVTDAHGDPPGTRHPTGRGHPSAPPRGNLRLVRGGCRFPRRAGPTPRAAGVRRRDAKHARSLGFGGSPGGCLLPSPTTGSGARIRSWPCPHPGGATR